MGTSLGPGRALLPGAHAHSPPVRRAPTPRPKVATDSGDPPSPAPHLLFALAAETQACGPLLVAVAVIGAGLVRLELHHPPSSGGSVVRVAGVEGEEPAPDGGARAHARSRLSKEKQGE